MTHHTGYITILTIPIKIVITFNIIDNKKVRNTCLNINTWNPPHLRKNWENIAILMKHKIQ